MARTSIKSYVTAVGWSRSFEALNLMKATWVEKVSNRMAQNPGKISKSASSDVLLGLRPEAKAENIRLTFERPGLPEEEHVEDLPGFEFRIRVVVYGYTWMEPGVTNGLGQPFGSSPK